MVHITKHPPPPTQWGGWDVPAQPFSGSWSGKAEGERMNGRWCSFCSSIFSLDIGGSTDFSVAEPYVCCFVGDTMVERPW